MKKFAKYCDMGLDVFHLMYPFIADEYQLHW